MGHKYLFDLLTNGTPLSDTDIASLGLPAVNSDLAAYISAKYTPNKVILTLASLPVTMVDEAGVTAYGGAKLLDCPAGAVLLPAAFANLTLNKTVATGVIADAFDGDFAIGTATATNTALASKTTGAAENDLIPYTTMAQAVSGATTAKGISRLAIAALADSTGGTADGTLEACADLSTTNTYADSAVNAKLAIIRNWAADLAAKINQLAAATGANRAVFADGTSTAADVFLNFLIDDADHNIASATPALYVSGTIVLPYQRLGDY